MDSRSKNSNALLAIFFIITLYIVWSLLHALDKALAGQFYWINNEGLLHNLYYLSKKIIFWVLPAILLARYCNLDLKNIMGLTRLKSIFLWGGGVGLAIGILALIVKTYTHQPIFSFAFDWNFYNAVLISPIVEELVFRGVALELLRTRFRFYISNVITGVLFLGIHLPGWYFQGRLFAYLLSLTGALSVFILGLIFGYVAYKSKSVAASTITHMLSNFFYY